ncbi:hypothetical protein AMELA_G00215650 [Ameiurus melas]|uniref:Uncharacterized protein n=1 Tax=Ameiurus melas TaxID=219545 RepID=A0A7J6A122_AMEME|nr:hypothetical protein AMELA_G00215650 [Ameiurus melas]
MRFSFSPRFEAYKCFICWPGFVCTSDTNVFLCNRKICIVPCVLLRLRVKTQVGSHVHRSSRVARRTTIPRSL